MINEDLDILERSQVLSLLNQSCSSFSIHQAIVMACDPRLEQLVDQCHKNQTCESIKPHINSLLSFETDKAKKVHRMFECELCRGLTYDPVKCKQCEQFYCKSEIENWMKTNPANMCPHCQSQDTAFEKLTRFERDSYNSIEIDCCPMPECTIKADLRTVEDIIRHLSF